MASNLECVGLGVGTETELGELIAELLPESQVRGHAGDVAVYRWEDRSGARLIVSLVEGRVLDLLPSFAGRPGAHLTDARFVNENVVTAAVVDDQGEQCTSLAVELEGGRLLRQASIPDGPATIVALGNSFTVHQSEEAFTASNDSLLDPNADVSADPPPLVAERGLKWPPRLARESFISYGVFADAATAEPRARLSGTVLSSAFHTSSRGGSFVVARVRTAGFEVDLCLAAREHPHPPAAGTIASGTAFLVGDVALPGNGARSRRSRWRRWLPGRSADLR